MPAVATSLGIAPGSIQPCARPGASALVLDGLLLVAQELLGRRVDVFTEASLHPACVIAC